MVIIELIKFWCIQLSIAKVFDLLQINDKSVSKVLIGSVYKNLRNLCIASVKNSKIKLGGLNKFVEIDESLVANMFTKRH